MNPTVTVYSKDGCVQCRATIRHLEKLGYPYILEDAAENARMLQNKGYYSAPVVVCHYADGRTASWNGYVPDRLNSLVN